MNVRYLSRFAGVVLCAVACSWDAAAQVPPKPTPATPATQKPKPPAKPPAKTPPKAAAKPEPAAPPEPPPPPPKRGVTMRSAYTAPDGQTSETKLITNLTRQRVELGPTVAVITQCDTKQILQVNDKHKLYVALPIDAPAAAAPAEPPKKTGQVDYTTAFSSAGETKDIFGVSTRRVTTVVTRTPTPTSCNKKKERIETDGWYAAIPSLACAPPQAKPPSEATDCVDEANATSSGEPPAGSPLGYTITTFGDDGKQTGLAKMEVKELVLAPVDEALLDVPAGYTKMSTPAEFVTAVERAENEARWGAPKAAGVIRIGVLIPTNKTTEDVSVEAIGDELLGSLSVAPYDAVPILSTTAEEQAAEMKGKEIDYIVALDLTTLKTSAPSKVGGLVRKASGGGNPSELHEAKVEYRLFAGGLAKPRVTKTAQAKTGGFTLKRALGLAQFAARLYLGAGPGMMKMMLSQGGGGGGVGLPSQSADPSLSAFSIVFNMLGSKTGPTDELSREATVVTALRNASSDILKELGSKKDK